MDAKEIIRALRLCMDNNLDACEACPAVNGHCEEVKGCAADLIERQAAEIAKYKGVGVKYEQEIQRLTKERDAAVRDMTSVADCSFICAYCIDKENEECDMKEAVAKSHGCGCFEWRGLCAENSSRKRWREAARMTCKWYVEVTGICCNVDCPVCGDYCPVSDYMEICKRAENAHPVPTSTHISEKNARMDAKEDKTDD